MPDSSDRSEGSRGIQVPQGARFRLTDFRPSFDDDGRLTVADFVTEIAMDIYPLWAGIAIDHLADASRENLTLQDAAHDSPEQHEALVAEMAASMQSINAVAFTLDALYASVRERVTVEQSTIDAWNTNRTSRSKRIGYVLRRAFRLSNRSAGEVDQFLRDAFEFRGWSVHPPAHFGPPQYRADLNVHVEWRHAAFRYRNAYYLVRNLLNLLEGLPGVVREDNEHLVQWSEACEEKARELRLKWVLRALPAPE